MATTESSAVIRLINSVQAQPILDSFHEPIPEPVSAPESPPLQAEFPTVMVQAPRRSRWPLYVLSAVVLLGGAIGAGYVIGQRGTQATPPAQPAAGAAPMLAQTDEPEQPTEPQPALARADEAERQAEAAVAITGADPTEPQAAVAFDAAFDIIVEPAGATVFLDGKELGPAPLRIGRLAPGAHTLEVQAPEGYLAQTIPLDLISGERQVIRLSLDAVDGVAAEPVDEPVADATPVVADEPAKRSFRTKRPARKAKAEREPKPEKVSRRSKKKSEKKAEKKSSKASGKTGTLMIGSKPPCQIYIDGKNTGLMTPQRALKVSPGKHKITLVNKQHGIKATASVRVKAGETKRLIKDMSSRL